MINLQSERSANIEPDLQSSRSTRTKYNLDNDRFVTNYSEGGFYSRPFDTGQIFILPSWMCNDLLVKFWSRTTIVSWYIASCLCKVL